jgi:Lhr-like helicase
LQPGIWQVIAVDYYRSQGRDCSISVTGGTYKRPMQKLLFPRYTVICVSRGDLPLTELVRRHRHKQGMENEFKGPLEALDLHHPPCLSVVANQMFYACGQLAHVLLRAVQYRLLPSRDYRRTIRTVIHDLIRTVARVVRSGRKLRLLFARTTWRLDWIHHAAVQLE